MDLQSRNLNGSYSTESPDSSVDNITGTLYAEEYKMNIKLQDQIKRLEVELKVKQNEIESRNLEIRDLSEEIDELRLLERQMRRQSKVMETQVKTLYEEREEILEEMQDQHETFLMLSGSLGLKDDDLADVNTLLTERTSLLNKIEELEKEVQRLTDKNAEGKFGLKMQEKIDQLVGSTELSQSFQENAMNGKQKGTKL